MTPDTQAALERSIAKWQGIVAGTTRDLGPSNCGLCQLFLNASCKGCPVFERTGQTSCRGTPYSDYTVIDEIAPDRALDAAKREVEFLESLRVPLELAA
jgi:hypothetical protein